MASEATTALSVTIGVSRVRLRLRRLVRRPRPSHRPRGALHDATTTAPPGMPTRTFGSFRAAALECADSRVRLDWHFRYSTDAGLELGERVARRREWAAP